MEENINDVAEENGANTEETPVSAPDENEYTDPVPAPGPETVPEPEPVSYAQGAYYEWDGAKMVKAKKKKGLKVFAVCMTLAFVAVCAAFALVLFGRPSVSEKRDRDTVSQEETYEKSEKPGKDKDKNKENGSGNPGRITFSSVNSIARRRS